MMRVNYSGFEFHEQNCQRNDYDGFSMPAKGKKLTTFASPLVLA